MRETVQVRLGAINFLTFFNTSDKVLTFIFRKCQTKNSLKGIKNADYFKSDTSDKKNVLFFI